jgi:hypothetical protein
MQTARCREPLGKRAGDPSPGGRHRVPCFHLLVRCCVSLVRTYASTLFSNFSDGPIVTSPSYTTLTNGQSLLLSSSPQTQQSKYWVGMEASGLFTPQQQGLVDSGCATDAQVFADDTGRLITFAVIPELSTNTSSDGVMYENFLRVKIVLRDACQ